MKKSLILSIFVAATCCAHANSGMRISNSRSKSFLRDSTETAIPSIQQMLDEITSAVGLQNNFVLKEANVLNIEAELLHKKRMILYNPLFMDWINKVTGNKWGSIALIAHEMGHHLNGHTLQKSGSEPALELEADEFAGAVLRKMGATLEESQRVMIFIATNEASKTHPARADRMEAIKKGWEK